MVAKIRNLERLCIHTITTKPLSFELACASYAALGVKGISIWRDAVAGLAPATVMSCLRNNDLSPVSYVRGGFFPALQADKRAQAIEENILMLQEAADMEIPMLVLVCGAEPGQSLQTSRDQIKEGVEALLPRAQSLGVKLAIEPLHPMYADSRSAINTLKQANDMAEALDSSYVGVGSLNKKLLMRTWKSKSAVAERTASCLPITFATGRCPPRTCSTTGD